MKITIEIDNIHAPDLLRFLADIHPDQKLTSSPDEADLRLAPLPETDGLLGRAAQIGKTESLAAWAERVVAADELKVAMDDPVEDTRPRLIPVPGKTYRTRHGKIMKCVDVDDFSIECLTEHGDEFYYHHDGVPRASDLTVPDYDLVEEITEPVAVQEDPTQRDLPMLTNFPPLPPLPLGKTRWVYRGTFDGIEIPAGYREVRYACMSEQKWSRTVSFSEYLHHIEAV